MAQPQKSRRILRTALDVEEVTKRLEARLGMKELALVGFPGMNAASVNVGFVASEMSCDAFPRNMTLTAEEVAGADAGFVVVEPVTNCPSMLL